MVRGLTHIAQKLAKPFSSTLQQTFKALVHESAFLSKAQSEILRMKALLPKKRTLSKVVFKADFFASEYVGSFAQPFTRQVTVSNPSMLIAKMEKMHLPSSTKNTSFGLREDLQTKAAQKLKDVKPKLLEPNETRIVDGFTFIGDEHGRTIEAFGKLSTLKAQRNPKIQQRTGGSDRLSIDFMTGKIDQIFKNKRFVQASDEYVYTKLRKLYTKEERKPLHELLRRVMYTEQPISKVDYFKARNLLKQLGIPNHKADSLLRHKDLDIINPAFISKQQMQYAQTHAPYIWSIADDEAGHIIAARFGGPAVDFNMIPMTPRLNYFMNDWERGWAKYILEKTKYARLMRRYNEKPIGLHVNFTAAYPEPPGQTKKISLRPIFIRYKIFRQPEGTIRVEPSNLVQEIRAHNFAFREPYVTRDMREIFRD